MGTDPFFRKKERAFRLREKGVCPLFVVSLLAVPAWAEVRLPDGDGKAIVAERCTKCHGLETVARGGYSAEGWRNTVSMMRNVGAQLTPAEADRVAAYLAKGYPERESRPPAIIPGPVRVEFREWTVPTAGSRPHDPLAARDGHLWYTGQFANQLGRLDPKTGEFREYPLPVANSGPHGLAEDREGRIWHTANFQGYIGRLDPKTGAVTPYKLPDPAARDPHTPAFDREGVLWFTVQSGNFVGRLDPKTGDIRLARSPTPRSRPYGIEVDANGVPWFVEFGTNKVARIDRATMAIREFTLPDPDARPRRIAITRDGAIWYTDYARGAIGRLDPATGKVREWPSPNGRESRPYGILADGDVIWYSESGVQPNTLVRFDPRDSKFQTWAIPSGGGVVRNMMLAPDGQLALAMSGVNGVGLVKTEAGNAENTGDHREPQRKAIRKR
jgi:virginiamycin B lyase